MFPSFFINEIEEYYGKNEALNIVDTFSKGICTTFRINTLKADYESVTKELKNIGIEPKESFFNNTAICLEPGSEKKVEELDIYKDGKIYMQSLSSMIPPIVLAPNSRDNILDMCAAPGGKTTQMAVISNNEALITACERNTIRAERLKYNIEKQSTKGIFVMNRDARDLDDFLSFDKILLDAPCSGSGTLFNFSGNNFSEDLVKKITKTQLSLLTKALKLIKQGGEIVYSTCSILREENEYIIKNILDNYKNVELVPIENDELKDIPKLKTTIDGTICIKPTQKFEGFFIAKLRKIA